MIHRPAASLAVLAISVGFGICVPFGCAEQKGATEMQLDAARKVAPDGAKLYKDSCAECHGARGEGQAGIPRVMGSRALPVKVKEKPPELSTMSDPAARERLQQTRASGPRELRRRFNTAADIHKYMMDDHPGLSTAVDSDQMWQILTFMLDAHGLKIPPGGLKDDNAASVKNEIP